MEVEMDLTAFSFEADNERDDAPEENEVELHEANIEFNSSLFKPTSSTHKEILTNVVWPRALPIREYHDEKKRDVDLGLITLMLDVLSMFENEQILSKRTGKMIKTLYKIRSCQTQEDLSCEINRMIKQIAVGDMIPVLVEKQNCGLIISRQSNEQVIVSTFPVALNSTDIYKYENSDIQVKFPNQSLIIDFSPMLVSIEFAEQIAHLNANEVRCTVADDEDDENTDQREIIVTNLVSQWLVPLLGTDRSQMATPAQFPVVWKKIRDDVIGTTMEDRKAFRRLPHWIALKVFVHISLIAEHGEDHGKYLYKLLMLKYLTALTGYYCDKNLYPTLQIDVATQTLAKLARRVEKLQQRYATTIKATRIIDDACRVICKVRQRINKDVEKLQRDDAESNTLEPLKMLNFTTDIQQKVPTLRSYIAKRKRQQKKSSNEFKFKAKQWFRYNSDAEGVPDLAIFEKFEDDKLLDNEIAINLYYYEFEISILNKLSLDIHSNDHSMEDLRRFSLVYGKIAEQYYQHDDQLGFSRMLLVQLKILALMDMMTVHVHGLYKQHRAGIDPAVFDYLLLPHRRQMEIAKDLQKYFRGRNESKEPNLLKPGLLEDERINGNSFAVRFAEINDNMQGVRHTILRTDEENRRRLSYEFEKAKKLAEEKLEKFNTMECNHRIPDGKKRARDCAKCTLESEMSRIKMDKYEKSLPIEEMEQNAVVFELLIPKEIACLRDVLANVVQLLHKQPAKVIQIQGSWNGLRQITSHNISCSERVFLGSTKRLKLSRPRKTKVTSKSTFDQFYLENGLDCVYYTSVNKLRTELLTKVEKQSAVHSSTFQIDKDSPYSCLQPTMYGTISENQVLANQNSCPQKLTLTEYNNFGSLRSDYRLQLRKLLTLIATESLSFDTKSVQLLVMQAIWQTGPNEGTKNSWYRDSHEDLTETDFASEMCSKIDQFIEKQQYNWSSPLKLAIMTLITVRIFEMNDNDGVIEQTVKLLLKLRSIAEKWMQDVKTAMNKTQDQMDLTKLRENLAEISIAGALTFFVDSQHKHFDKVFTSSNERAQKTASQLWLEFAVTMNSNILLNETHQIQSNRRMFVRLVRQIGIGVERKVKQQIAHNDQILKRFIRSQWTDSNHAVIRVMKNDSIQQFVARVEKNEKMYYVLVDPVTGIFTVNNLPVARLSTKITNHDTFKRVFDQFVFEVQQEGRDNFSTILKCNNFNYTFGLDEEAIIITEKHDNGDEYELIPHEMLRGEVPLLLVENFSHWWDHSKNTIDFRPKNFKDEKFWLKSGIQYQLNVKKGTLMHLKSKRLLLDVTSTSHEKITKRLARLEIKNFIHISMDGMQDDNAVKEAVVELVRMRLKFIVKPHSINSDRYDIWSNEYSGMCVTLQQNCGTLFGLRHGLLLENSSASKILIMPHGKVNAERTEKLEIVEIDMQSELRSPPFYTYQVDEVCRQLKAKNINFSAWFYLAYLHALTSHSEPEPLTGLSGTERALQILQSSFVWSSAPYDDEALKTLHLLESLSPKRKLINGKIRVDWPKTVRSHAAQDAYLIITQKLIRDSERLKGLHSPSNKLLQDEEKTKVKHRTNHGIVESEREYFRCLPLHPNLRISNTFLEHEPSFANQHVHKENCAHLKTLRKLSTLYHDGKSLAPADLKLRDFLITSNLSPELVGQRYSGDGAEDEMQLLYESDGNFANLWIALYEIARKPNRNREKFTLMLSFLAFKGCNADIVLALQSIFANTTEFTNIKPPDALSYDLNHLDFDQNVIEKIIQTHCTLIPTNDQHSSEEYDQRSKDEMTVINFAYKKAKSIQSHYASHSTQIQKTFFEHDRVQVDPEAVEAINMKLKNWNDIYQLGRFIDKVQEKVHDLYLVNPSIGVQMDTGDDEDADSERARDGPIKFEIDYEKKMCENLDMYEEYVDMAESIYNRSENEPLPPLGQSAAEWWELFKKIAMPPNSKHLIDAGIFPRFVPTLMLPRIIRNDNQQASDESDRLKRSKKLNDIIGTYAIALSCDQREKRIKLCTDEPQLKVALDREMENHPMENWSPRDYPERLIFEIEQNLTIRRIQTEIAKRMINPPPIKTKHSVMQLNMGEGKTAVIVPILATNLANGAQVCQVTVLKSLFATNLKLLRQSLGGMLNRRIYTFPCRRDLPVNDHIKQMLNIYEECKVKKGVILTLPEYQLSMQLKIYESAHKEEIECAGDYLEAHKWLNNNVRNILDESDAILHPKYQLIYTVGNQRSLDGGTQRWHTIQDVLKQVNNHVKALHEKHGNEKIEFDKNYLKNACIYGAGIVEERSDVFYPCRILDENVCPELKTALIDSFLQTNQNADANLRSLLGDEKITKNQFDAILKSTTANINSVLIMCGLLRFDILKMVLKKRWRVNYGADLKSKRKMAVPFKAKDVAAEKTEFGHPDIAISLTYLSYYYSGLTDEQLQDVFEMLDNQQNRIEVYEGWIRSIPDKLVDDSIKSYTSINLSDPKQRNEIVFPLFKYNMDVINFWLSNMVFPREAKTFEKKLMCTAWDLCSENLVHKVSGFSGTNDTKNILPKPISQNDLAELEDTNNEVRDTLLREENASYVQLSANISGISILKQLVKSGMAVLLDAGALMLELNNEQVAREWLKLASDEDYDAAVYFSGCNVLMSIDRNDEIAEFDNSVYRDKLDKCLVYLDDMHTRGTDLKFPVGRKACVTLSGDITRDKTVQACMRMRLLGRGHSIAFWASFEADTRIRQLCTLGETKPTNAHVFKFICANSNHFEEENTVHWYVAALNYTKKIAAIRQSEKWLSLEYPEKQLKYLYEQCVDDEFVTLKDMYGIKDASQIQTAIEKFAKLQNSHRSDRKIAKFIDGIGIIVKKKLQKQEHRDFAPDFDEEQEKELEQELEEERKVIRPPPAVAVQPKYNECLKDLIRGKQTISSLLESKSIVRIAETLHGKRLYARYKRDDDAWADNLFATTDFSQVISTENGSGDEFLRPVRWIVEIPQSKLTKKENKPAFLLVSSYECNKLLPYLRLSKSAVLRMYEPRLSQVHNNLLHEKRLMVTAMDKEHIQRIDLKLEAQIAVFTGSMYFGSDAEQNAYCNFIGVVPRPFNTQQTIAFANKKIQPNGFVAEAHRNSLHLKRYVGECRFKQNPIDLAIQIIELRHQFMRKESHVASILEKATKTEIRDATASTEAEPMPQCQMRIRKVSEINQTVVNQNI